jgi:hypothetical protein
VEYEDSLSLAIAMTVVCTHSHVDGVPDDIYSGYRALLMGIASTDEMLIGIANTSE